MATMEEAIALAVEYHQAGNFYKGMGRFQEAEASLREALRLRPADPEILVDLGTALAQQGRVEEGLVSFHEALRHRHDYPLAHYNLGIALRARNKQDEAVASYEEAIRLKPDYAEALNNLASAYKDQGRMEEAIACYRKAAAAQPASQVILSNLLCALQYPATYDPEATFAEHRRWADLFCASLPPPRLPPARDRAPSRRLRVGYVSPDFREHVLGRYSAAVIAAHDRRQVEVFCYANVGFADALTQRIKNSADHWRLIVGLSDDQVAEWIRGDSIDVLIDLAGHSGGNNLGVFARKPAPIQATHLGYLASTGLAAMDYRLTDAYSDPPGQTERYHTERLVHLPALHWCYLPTPEPEVGPLPARRSGEITFGSFNNLCKVTETMIGLWAQILKGLPGSRMLVLTGAGKGGDQRVLAAFARNGVEKERVTLLGWQTPDAFLRLHHDVDICLDTYPFTGCYTTADALWMGVPVVTRAGPSCVTRQGIGVLVEVGLEELVTSTPAAYVAAAVALARDLPRLEELRARLRERLRRSLGNVQRFTSHLEAAYRTMWERFCL